MIAPIVAVIDAAFRAANGRPYGYVPMVCVGAIIDRPGSSGDQRNKEAAIGRLYDYFVLRIHFPKRFQQKPIARDPPRISSGRSRGSVVPRRISTVYWK